MGRRDGADDGRVIADMSEVPGAGLPLRGGREAQPLYELHPGQEPYTAKERLRYILTATKAGLLIALAYIVGLGLVVALMCWLL